MPKKEAKSSIDMQDRLNSAILNSYPKAQEIVSIQSYRAGYLPYPACLTIKTTDGRLETCTLKVSKNSNKISFEGSVLEALTEIGLSVPRVLIKPITIEDESTPITFLLISEIPGESLPWIDLSDLNTAHQTCLFVHNAVDTLHALTPNIKSHPIATLLPTISLESELQSILSSNSEWQKTPIFAESLEILKTFIPEVAHPLVFSNGDYNPLNFLISDNRLVGWIDFEHACFEDPYIGFAKFFLWANDDYGWGAGLKTGLVERYLYNHNVSQQEFLVRLILRGASYLNETSPTDAPEFMLKVFTESIERLKAYT